MQNQINLVQGDTGPDLTLMLYDAVSNLPIDVSGAAVVRMYIRREDQTGTPVIGTVTAGKPSGGADGVVNFQWPVGTWSIAGYYEAEVEMTLGSGTIQTVPDKIRFYVREQIA
jgi:hypothetical protein